MFFRRKNNKKNEVYEWSHKAVNEAIGSDYRRKTKLNKIGVLLQHPNLFSRFLSIVRHLDRSEFDILYVACEEEKRIKQFAEENNFSFKNLITSILDREQYAVILSHNVWFCMNVSNGYLPSIIGESHVRLIYTSGVEKEELCRKHNIIYDGILCYGPRQENILKNNVNADICVIGNPRFDDYFNNHVYIDNYKNSLNLNTEKKTILWLPTISGYNSIKLFMGIMEKLSNTYNVILSPHGIISEEDLEIIKNSKLQHIFTKENNMNLFKISDFVFCDYGGSALSAMFFDKNIVLLDHDDFSKIFSLAGADSSEFYIRKHIKHYSKEGAATLMNDLVNNDIWDKQKEIRNTLANEFFINSFGTSGYFASKFLKKFLRKP